MMIELEEWTQALIISHGEELQVSGEKTASRAQQA